VKGHFAEPNVSNDGFLGHHDAAVFGSAIGIGYGVKGLSTGSAGVYGMGVLGVWGEGESAGILGKASGSSTAAYGVKGAATAGTGVVGVADSGTGVKGVSSTGDGVVGTGSGAAGSGVRGEQPNATGVKGLGHTGVSGVATASNGVGVEGQANTGGAAIGVHGISSSGWAGYFEGKVEVTGILHKGGGAFKIDHPLDPENKYLYHSFVESPDMLDIYNGNVLAGADGLAVVELPAWFEALNRDFRYQLTPIGALAQVAVVREIEGNRFTIRSSVPDLKVSWQVTGVRKDPFAERYRIPVEEDKPEGERGTYLHPEAWGQPEDRRVGHERQAPSQP
jgi:hypothetical protein